MSLWILRTPRSLPPPLLLLTLPLPFYPIASVSVDISLLATQVINLVAKKVEAIGSNKAVNYLNPCCYLHLLS